MRISELPRLIRIVETGWIRERLQPYMDEEKVIQREHGWHRKTIGKP
jgi:hypothetical protein